MWNRSSFFSRGICIGLALTELLIALRIARMFAVVAGFELVLLVIFMLLAHPARQWMVVWPACAMGVQNAMLRRVGHHKVRTTFITGMLTNMAEGLVQTIAELAARSGHAREKFADFAFYGGIWLSFACGGIFAAFLALSHGSAALLLPIAALAILVAYDVVSPVTATPAEQASGD
ncbi:MAG TPA: YoaK family protein [Candidatus Baltobacteraceae bacterium]|nr:YoaK family protein [Candidatus Baltobacteraceae bacterium]